MCVLEYLDICGCVNLNRRDQNIVDIFRLYPQTRECIDGTLTFITSQFPALTEAATPACIQSGQVFGRPSIDDGSLAIATNDDHTEIELDAIVPVTHPVTFWTHHVALAHL